VEMYYTVINNVPHLSAMTDRYVYQQEGGVPPLPTATVFPSKHIATFCGLLNHRLKDMIGALEIKNGLLLFQSVVDGDDFYLYEMAYRLTGEQHYHIIQKEHGVDLLKIMLELAIHGQTNPDLKINHMDIDCLPLPACNIAVLLRKGIIRNIQGLDEIVQIPEVLSCVQTLKEGNEIKETGNYGQMGIRLNIIAEDRKRLAEIIRTINQKLVITSERNTDMILTRFDENNIF